MTGRDWDLAVVGAGVAGLTAARDAARGGLTVIAFDRLAPGGQLVNLTGLHDWPSPGAAGATGPELMTELVAEAEDAGVQVAYTEVERVRPGSPLRVDTTEGEIVAGAVVVATGLSAGRLGLPGEEALVGRGISTCAGCDGPLFRGRPVAVVGDDEWTAAEALELAGLASAVTVLVPGSPRWSAARDRALADEPRVEVLTGTSVTGLLGEGVLSGVVVRTGAEERELAVAGLFPFVGRRGPDGLVEGAAADGTGRLVAEDGVRTAVRNLFVAGDARAGCGQTLLAVAEDGAAAGSAAVAVLHPVVPGGLRVVDPTAGVAPDEPEPVAPAGPRADWTRVALFSNSKPNATDLLRGVGDRLQAHWALDEVGFASKPNASAGADPDTIDWLAQRFRMVLLAVGD